MTSEEEDDQEVEAPVKLMLIVLNEDAIQGFHEQVVKEQGAGGERGEGWGPHEAATMIQSSWRMRQARQELQRLRQQQESQAEAAAHQVLSPDMHGTALQAGTQLMRQILEAQMAVRPISERQPLRCCC